MRYNVKYQILRDILIKTLFINILHGLFISCLWQNE